MFPSARLAMLPLEQRWLPSWGIALSAQSDPDFWQSATGAAGRVAYNLDSGDAAVAVPLDFRQSAPSPDFGPPALVYHSTRLSSSHPIVQATVASDPLDPVPTQLSATLTFNGTAQSAVVFGTSGHAAGDVYLLAVQQSPSTLLPGSSFYPWSLAVTVSSSGSPTCI